MSTLSEALTASVDPRICPWTWHGLPCLLGRAHPSPHAIVGEQPQFAAIDASLRRAEAVIEAAVAWRTSTNYSARTGPWKIESDLAEAVDAYRRAALTGEAR